MARVKNVPVEDVSMLDVDVDYMPEPDEDEGAVEDPVGVEAWEEPAPEPGQIAQIVAAPTEYGDGPEDPTGFGGVDIDAEDPAQIRNAWQEEAVKRHQQKPPTADRPIMRNAQGWHYVLMDEFVFDGVQYAVVWPKYSDTLLVVERSTLYPVAESGDAVDDGAPSSLPSS